jgi:hypothetical protein
LVIIETIIDMTFLAAAMAAVWSTITTWRRHRLDWKKIRDNYHKEHG